MIGILMKWKADKLMRKQRERERMLREKERERV